MIEAFRTTLSDWNNTTTDRQKLQHTYVAMLVAITFLAGLVALFNGERSRQLMYISLALVTTIVVNFVVWSLLKTVVLDKLPKATRPARSKR